VRIIIALIMLALWPAMTSHALLQQFELIHEVHDDHDGSGGSHEHDSDDDHDFADGGYLNNSSSSVSILKTLLAATASPFVASLSLTPVTVAPAVFNSGLAPPGTGPPELLHCWQFFFRAALPVRAPSVIS
jgi:hypothetical protein